MPLLAVTIIRASSGPQVPFSPSVNVKVLVAAGTLPRLMVHVLPFAAFACTVSPPGSSEQVTVTFDDPDVESARVPEPVVVPDVVPVVVVPLVVPVLVVPDVVPLVVAGGFSSSLPQDATAKVITAEKLSNVSKLIFISSKLEP